MPDTPALAQIERRLAELACPEKLARRKIRELAEHHEDLKQDALEEGLSEADAEARANALLGNPAGLAERLAAALRQSSWWGRHPIVGFCLLPPFVILSFLGLALWAEFGVARIFITADELTALTGVGSGLEWFRAIFRGTYFVAIAVAAILFCWLARRTLTGMKWGWIACGVCALHGIFFQVSIMPHTLTLGYSTAVNWGGLGIPLGTAFAVWLKFRFGYDRRRVIHS